VQDGVVVTTDETTNS